MFTGSDPQELKDKYGEKICFFGGIDQQELLPSGDIKRIRTEIKERIAFLEKTGVIFLPRLIFFSLMFQLILLKQ